MEVRIEIGLQEELDNQPTSVSSKVWEFTHLPGPFHDSCVFSAGRGRRRFFCKQKQLMVINGNQPSDG